MFLNINVTVFRYRAQFNYRPQNEDELELHDGDLVYVMEKCDDGWFVGTSDRTKEFGTFPGNYVRLVRKYTIKIIPFSNNVNLTR